MLKTQVLQHLRADAEDRKPKAHKEMQGGDLPELRTKGAITR